jgi:hypothetical protein
LGGFCRNVPILCFDICTISPLALIVHLQSLLLIPTHHLFNLVTSSTYKIFTIAAFSVTFLSLFYHYLNFGAEFRSYISIQDMI